MRRNIFIIVGSILGSILRYLIKGIHIFLLGHASLKIKKPIAAYQVFC